ncbi:MAG: hypothetical protein EOO15_01555 [Chitinophagaceae bacterium]|nr:MAG: hypothetical protein EOO15_01555 [Chitinophagaceae bacterium]
MIVIIMGVAGSGKSTIGQLLARRLSLPFLDADDYHSPTELLRSQLETLERPAYAICSSIDAEPAAIVEGIVVRLGRSS